MVGRRLLHQHIKRDGKRFPSPASSFHGARADWGWLADNPEWVPQLPHMGKRFYTPAVYFHGKRNHGWLKDSPEWMPLSSQFGKRDHGWLADSPEWAPTSSHLGKRAPTSSRFWKKDYSWLVDSPWWAPQRSHLWKRPNEVKLVEEKDNRAEGKESKGLSAEMRAMEAMAME